MLDRLWRIVLRWKARRLFKQRVEVFGNFTVINPANVSIGSRCAINHGVFILGRTGITIEDDVVLSARCMLLDGGLQTAGFESTETRGYEEAPIKIEQGAWIGAGAIVLPGVTIGARSVVGAGSVVTKDVEECQVVAGNPARVIGSTKVPAR
jgi:maltose O-acetyltransferase